MSNPNIEYEKLVAEIHQAMLNHDGFENLRVEHDIVIIGRSGAKHQIDVFWEFNAAGTTYRTCVECKKYKSSVKKLHVASFATILEDIGNANGIIATTSSYQKGAKQLAKDRNIRLVLVRNLVKTIHLTGHYRIPQFDNLTIKLNEIKVQRLMEIVGISTYEISGSLSGEYPLFDVNGNVVESFNSLIEKSNLSEGTNTINGEGLYLKDKIGLLPLETITFDLIYKDSEIVKNTIQVNEDAKAILRDIVDNNIHYLKNDGSISIKKIK